jgi:hypothetical protein
MAESPHRTGTPNGRREHSTGSDETANWDGTIVAQPALMIRGGGELQGKILEIRPGKQTIGREPGCELRIDDGFVSRRHAILMWDRDAIWIEDAGSANGTGLNGEQLLKGRRRPLRSGDIVLVGRIDLVYLDGSETTARRQALLQPPEGSPVVEVLSRSPTDDTPVLQRPPTRAPSLEPKADVSPLMPVQLVLSAAAASVTALLLSRLNVDQLGVTVGAGLTTVVTTFLQTRGRRQWLRVTTGAGLALALAVGGVTVPEIAFGNPNRPLTFVPSKLDPRPTTTTTTTTITTNELDISVDPNPDLCPDTAVGQVETCPVVTIRSTGFASLLVRSFEIVGPAADEFQVVTDVANTIVTGTTVAGLNCIGRPLARDEVCTVEVTFQPKQAGLQSATLIVHQNLPKPDTGTRVDLIGHGVGEPTTT